MIFNKNPSFAGIEKLKKAHRAQIEDFEKWAAQDKWYEFHDAHYDWWTFPINRPSSYGFMWTVFEGDIAELKKDADFLKRYWRGVELVSASWGWDVAKKAYIPNPKIGQSWQQWPIRLFKASLSVKLFGYAELFDSLKIYAGNLMEQGEIMRYNGKDLTWLFTNGIDPESQTR